MSSTPRNTVMVLAIVTLAACQEDQSAFLLLADAQPTSVAEVHAIVTQRVTAAVNYINGPAPLQAPDRQSRNEIFIEVEGDDHRHYRRIISRDANGAPVQLAEALRWVDNVLLFEMTHVRPATRQEISDAALPQDYFENAVMLFGGQGAESRQLFLAWNKRIPASAFDDADWTYNDSYTDLYAYMTPAGMTRSEAREDDNHRALEFVKPAMGGLSMGDAQVKVVNFNIALLLGHWDG